jgi:hypothetical protein
MLAATALAVFFIPVSFDVVERFGIWISGGEKREPGQVPAPAEEAAHD